MRPRLPKFCLVLSPTRLGGTETGSLLECNKGVERLDKIESLNSKLRVKFHTFGSFFLVSLRNLPLSQFFSISLVHFYDGIRGEG